MAKHVKYCTNIAKMAKHVEILYQWLNMSNIVQISYFHENMATKVSQCGSLDMSLSESYDLIHEHI